MFLYHSHHTSHTVPHSLFAMTLNAKQATQDHSASPSTMGFEAPGLAHRLSYVMSRKSSCGWVGLMPWWTWTTSQDISSLVTHHAGVAMGQVHIWVHVQWVAMHNCIFHKTCRKPTGKTPTHSLLPAYNNNVLYKKCLKIIKDLFIYI